MTMPVEIKMWNRTYKDLKVPKQDIEIIRVWLKQQPHLPDELDELLIRKFLTRCPTIQRSKQFIDDFFTMRHYTPELFKNRNPLAAEIKKVHSTIQIALLPNITKDGFRIQLYRVIDPDASHFHLDSILKYVTMLHDYRLTTEPDSRGDIWIYDVEKTSASFIARFTMSILKKYLAYNQDGQPIKIYQTHLINAPPIIDAIVNIVKPLLSPMGQKLIFTHRPNTTTIYDYVSRDDLPKEFGGTFGSIEQYEQDCIKRVENYRDFYQDENKWEINDSKRPGGSKASKLEEGSFKSLNLD